MLRHVENTWDSLTRVSKSRERFCIGSIFKHTPLISIAFLRHADGSFSLTDEKTVQARDVSKPLHQVHNNTSIE